MKILPGKHLEQIGKIKGKKENHMKFKRKSSQKRMLNSLNATEKFKRKPSQVKYSDYMKN